MLWNHLSARRRSCAWRYAVVCAANIETSNPPAHGTGDVDANCSQWLIVRLWCLQLFSPWSVFLRILHRIPWPRISPHTLCSWRTIFHHMILSLSCKNVGPEVPGTRWADIQLHVLKGEGGGKKCLWLSGESLHSRTSRQTEAAGSSKYVCVYTIWCG